MIKPAGVAVDPFSLKRNTPSFLFLFIFIRFLIVTHHFEILYPFQIRDGVFPVLARPLLILAALSVSPDSNIDKRQKDNRAEY